MGILSWLDHGKKSLNKEQNDFLLKIEAGKEEKKQYLSDHLFVSAKSFLTFYISDRPAAMFRKIYTSWGEGAQTEWDAQNITCWTWQADSKNLYIDNIMKKKYTCLLDFQIILLET